MKRSIWKGSLFHDKNIHIILNKLNGISLPSSNHSDKKVWNDWCNTSYYGELIREKFQASENHLTSIVNNAQPWGNSFN